MLTNDVAYVTNVIDGDTFRISNRTVRLASINAPEWNTAPGQKATAYLRHLIERQEVIIKILATDTYKRSVAKVWRSSDKLYINQEMVDSGNAERA